MAPDFLWQTLMHRLKSFRHHFHRIANILTRNLNIAAIEKSCTSDTLGQVNTFFLFPLCFIQCNYWQPALQRTQGSALALIM